MATSKAMTTDLDIYRSAKLLIDQHGDAARIFAVMQAACSPILFLNASGCPLVPPVVPQTAILRGAGRSSQAPPLPTSQEPSRASSTL